MDVPLKLPRINLSPQDKKKIVIFSVSFFSLFLLFLVSMMIPRTRIMMRPKAEVIQTSFWENLSFVKLFGQNSLKDISTGTVTAGRTFHTPGVAVDKSVTPNRLYVADSGNNRILGLKEAAKSGKCRNSSSSCYVNSDCSPIIASQSAELSTIGPCNKPLISEYECWGSNYFPSPEGYLKNYVLASNGWKFITNVQIGTTGNYVLRFGYVDALKNLSTVNSVSVWVNRAQIWTSPSVTKDDPIRLAEIDLNPYKGTTIEIVFFVKRTEESGPVSYVLFLDPKIFGTAEVSDVCDFPVGERPANIVIGQPDFNSSACNGDSNMGMFKNPDAKSLCFIPYPIGTNAEEHWMKINFDVDSSGNLYIPDVYNNRILVYYQPFSEDKTNGKGDSIADFVIGQDDFTGNKCNKGMLSGSRDNTSLCLNLPDQSASARGVSVDKDNNVWVADTFNNRVLRFPSGSQKANLVLGQKDFISFDQSSCDQASAPLDKMCHPILAKLNPETGKVYVLDESGYKEWYGRILIFSGNPNEQVTAFTNGVPAYKVIRPTDPSIPEYYFQSSGFTFNTYKQGAYAAGVLWVGEIRGFRASLLDENGNVIKKIGAPLSGSFTDPSCNGSYYGNCGQSDYQVCMPNGGMAMDDKGSIYFADEEKNKIYRINLPYELSPYTNPNNNVTYSCPPKPAEYILSAPTDGRTWNTYGGNGFNSGSVGVIAAAGQLLVRDWTRVLVWNDYLNNSQGKPADFAYGQVSLTVNDNNPTELGARGLFTEDSQGRIWTTNQNGKISVLASPLSITDPLIAKNIPLVWKDDPNGPEISNYNISSIAFSKDDNNHVWLSDSKSHRLLRAIVPSPFYFNSKLTVDLVIGQTNKTGSCCNKRIGANNYCPYDIVNPITEIREYLPDQSSICVPNQLEFDNFGNLYVVEGGYEGHGNERVLMYEKNKINIGSAPIFPAVPIKADKVFVQKDFVSASTSCGTRPNQPCHPMVVAFDKENRMIIGTDGYYYNQEERYLRQLWLYSNPLEKDSAGNYLLGQKPDNYIKLPIGAVGEIQFDEQNNLIVQDHTWPRVWVVNYYKDPQLLVPINVPSTPTPTAIPTPTDTPIPTETPIPTATETPTNIPTPTITLTPTPTLTAIQQSCGKRCNITADCNPLETKLICSYYVSAGGRICANTSCVDKAGCGLCDCKLSCGVNVPTQIILPSPTATPQAGPLCGQRCSTDTDCDFSSTGYRCSYYVSAGGRICANPNCVFNAYKCRTCNCSIKCP